MYKSILERNSKRKSASRRGRKLNICTLERVIKEFRSFKPAVFIKWPIYTQTGKIGSGKNKKIFIFPTGLEVHLEDMF